VVSSITLTDIRIALEKTENLQVRQNDFPCVILYTNVMPFS
jgi:hypothetical protein